MIGGLIGCIDVFQPVIVDNTRLDVRICPRIIRPCLTISLGRDERTDTCTLIRKGSIERAMDEEADIVEFRRCFPFNEYT